MKNFNIQFQDTDYFIQYHKTYFCLKKKSIEELLKMNIRCPDISYTHYYDWVYDEDPLEDSIMQITNFIEHKNNIYYLIPLVVHYITGKPVFFESEREVFGLIEAFTGTDSSIIGLKGEKTTILKKSNKIPIMLETGTCCVCDKKGTMNDDINRLCCKTHRAWVTRNINKYGRQLGVKKWLEKYKLNNG